MEPSAAKIRRGEAIRIAISVLVAAGLATSAILALWGPLEVHTDVVGYPIFANFNVGNYFRLYYLGVGFFPLAALGIYLALSRWGARIGLPAAAWGGLRPAAAADPGHALDPEPPLDDAAPALRSAVSVGRTFFVGAVLGFEGGIAADSIWAGLAIGVTAYAVVAWLAARLLTDRGPWREQPFEARLAALNAVGAVLTVAGLLAVSMSTEVKVLSDGSVKHYDWFPAWLALPVGAALVALVGRYLWQARSAARLLAIERRALLLAATPVALLLLIQVMPGDLGAFDTFHYGEVLAGGRLVEDGFFPWRDVVLTHGLLQDVVYTFGEGIFGNSGWGWFAGSAVVLGPLYLVSVYYLCVYLLGRNWLLVGFAVLVLADALIAPNQFRLILWPPILLVLAALLERATRPRAIGLAALVVAQGILTPETAPAPIAVAAVLVLYEWYWRRPGTPIRAAFPRTIWVAATGIALGVAFAIYLAASGALDDYLYISTRLLHGHALSGGIPAKPNVGTISQARFDFYALAPPIALVVSFAYAVARLRLRRPFLTADWLMGATAIFVALYYTKFLSRMDTGHVYEPFVASLPLLFYILYRATATIEAALRRRWPRNPALRLTAHPLSLIAVVAIVIFDWSHLDDQVSKAPDRYRPVVAERPSIEKVGYDESFDATGFRDLERVVDAYLRPGDRLFDFSNEPALFFYLMDRDPSTRYFHVSLAISEELQRDLIDRLRRARPKLIVFDDTDSRLFGLSNWDGIPNMVRNYLVSRWILDRYRPLLTSHGHTFYARPGTPPPSRLGLDLTQMPVTGGVPFMTQQCSWGYAPSFLSGAALPPSGARGVAVRTSGVSNPKVTLTGWAADTKASAPAREVIAVAGGKIVGRTVTRIERPDLPASGLPLGFVRSGFRLQVPVAALRGRQVHLYGVAADGSVGELPAGATPPPSGSARVGERTVRLDPAAVTGHFDTTLGPPTVQLNPPHGSRWSDYRWLEIDAPKTGFQQGFFSVFDRPSRPAAGREIAFQTLARSPDRYVVPVGSCAQWHGYGGSPLYLAVSPDQDISGVRLIR